MSITVIFECGVEMSPRKITAPILVRLPVDIKIWLEIQACRNGASQNSEIVRCIRARMDGEQKAGR
jgi:hypothetical protein